MFTMIDGIASRLTARTHLIPLAVVLSVTIGGGFLAHFYGASAVLADLAHANAWMLGVVVLLGGIIQLIRAQRAQTLLAASERVHFGQVFSALVVGHGFGDLVPIAPGGLVARCSLSERLSRIPAGFSAGVFMFEGMLDGLAPAVLIGYLMLVVSFPGWTRWILTAALCQCGLCLAAPCLKPLLARWPAHSPIGGSRLAPLARLAGQMAAGVSALASRGRRTVAVVLTASFLVTALEGLQLTVLLRAFGLTTSPNEVLLILVLTLAGNGIPIKVPGSGTIMLAGVLALGGIHGPGVPGFILASRAIATGETAAIASAIVVWWSVRRSLSAQRDRRRRPKPSHGGSDRSAVMAATAQRHLIPDL